MSTMSWLKYDEIAIPRILEMYKRCEIKQTFFLILPGVWKNTPLVEMILEGGHEIAAHGYLHENPNNLSAEDELYWFERRISVIKKMTAETTVMESVPLYNFSKHSMDYLVIRESNTTQA